MFQQQLHQTRNRFLLAAHHFAGAGELRVEGNQVVGNAIGVYLNTAAPPEISQTTNRIQGNREADLRRGDDQAPASSEGDQP